MLAKTEAEMDELQGGLGIPDEYIAKAISEIRVVRVDPEEKL